MICRRLCKSSVPLRYLALPLAFIGPAALACFDPVDQGIHFKGGPVDFGLPPARGSLYWVSYDYGQGGRQANYWRPGTQYLGRSYDRDYERAAARTEKLEKQAQDGFRKARAEEKRGAYNEALATYRDLRKNPHSDAVFLSQRIDLLKVANGRDLLGLKFLLAAQAARKKDSVGPLPALYSPEIRMFVAYAESDWQNALGFGRRAAAKLFDIAQKDPKAPWADACLITSARYLLSDAVKPSMDDMHLADAALRLLLSDCSNSRFALNAQLWLARIDYLNHRTEKAIHRYRFVIQSSKSDYERRRAYESISTCYASMGLWAETALWRLKRFATSNGADNASLGALSRMVDTFRGASARRFWSLLSKDPSALAAYLDYRLDFTETTPDLLALGGTSLKDAAPSVDRAHSQARLAEAALRLKQISMANSLAHFALRGKNDADTRARATFLLATLAQRDGRYRQSEGLYRSILRQRPVSYLAGGAKENLAILAERRGDLAEALDIYGDLGYDQDFAYMADARMTPRELAAYVRRPDARRRSVLIYTLGMRYLRLANWNDAERTFHRLTTAERLRLTQPRTREYTQWITDQGGLQDPMITLNRLRDFDQASQMAKDPERKAWFRLKLADYYYTHRYLLLYSANLWDGNRAFSISYSWNQRAATPKDDQALARHHEEHDCLAQSLRICQEIVRNYPTTRAAKHAAYRGGCAAERLAHMAPYWRWKGARQDLLGTAISLFKIASQSEDSVLSTQAKKYASVFGAERHGTRMAFASEGPPPRRWKGGYDW